MRLSDLLLRLRALFFRRQSERDLDDELAFHVAMETRKNQAAGMSAEEAARQARRQFGAAAHIQEQCRDARRIAPIENTWRDLRYALRSFRRTPVFAATVVATIAVGLGLVTALFTVLDAFYLRPLAVRAPHSLYEIYWTDRTGEGHDFTWPQYRDLLAQNPALSEAFAFRRADARLDGRAVSGILVSPEYFRVLGIGAALGRTLLPEDATAPGRDPVLVLSYPLWQHRFGADPVIVGKTLLLRGRPFQVIGVAPAGFNGLGARPTDFWAPLTLSAAFDNGPDLFGPKQPALLGIVGRLAPGFTVHQAEAGIAVWQQRLPENFDRPARAVFVTRETTKPFNPKNAVMFALVLAAFAVVLLIGCANVANMMLARSLARQREIGVRLSLGASRSRLIRQLLTESLLLAVPAAFVGLALSRGMIALSIRVLLATLPPGITDFATRIPDLSLDPRIFAFGVAAALAAALLFGLAPALEATRADLIQATRGEFARALRPGRLRNLLVAGEVGVCVLLLITAAILLHGVRQVGVIDRGLSTRDNLALRIDDAFRPRVVERLSADPSVGALAAAAAAPVDRKPMLAVTPDEGGAATRMAANAVSPDYFSLFEIGFVSGRNFTPQEAATAAPVAIVSQSTARRLWPNRNAVGRFLRMAGDPRPLAVIGVARDEISRRIMSGDENTLLYTPVSALATGSQLFLRPRGEAEAERRKIDAALSAIDANAVLEIYKLQIQAWVTEDTYSFRILYWVCSAIGGLALLLTLSGIYGIIAYAVSQRTKEIGVRMAMGATRQSVTTLVLRESLRLAAAGTLAGGIAALGLAKVLSTALAMIDAFDIPAYFAGASLVLIACAAASYFPARRAARIDPLAALRHD